MLHELTPENCAVLGRLKYHKLPSADKELIASATPDHLSTILQSAMQEPANLPMVGVVLALCTRNTMESLSDHRPIAAPEALQYDRVAGYTHEFLQLQGLVEVSMS